MLPVFTLMVAAGKTDPIDEWVKIRMERDHIPGMVVGVYRDGRAIKVKAYGKNDLERNVAARKDSPFEICSITKQFAATAVLMLADEGKLSLSDPLTKYFPEADASWKEITIADVLHHLSGLPHSLETETGISPVEDGLAAFVKTKAAAPAETRWEYNNSAYMLLDPIIAKVSGEPTWSFVKRRIFDPLGMRHTYPNPRTIDPRRVRGYLWDGKNYLNAVALTDGTTAGSLVSTPDDLALWSEALRRGKLLKPESRQTMLTPGKLKSGDVAWNSMSDGYGCGVFLRTVDGKRIEKHSGGWDTASAQLTRMLDDGLTIVVLTNRGGLGERPWWGEEIGELVTKRKLLPSFEAATDPDPGRTAKVRALLEKETKDAKIGVLSYVRAVPQGEATAFQYIAEIDGPKIVTVWQQGDKLELDEVFPVPQTK